MKSTLAKVLGWIGFIGMAIPSIVNQTGTHGAPAIIQAIGALVAAAGVHAAASTNGQN